MNIWYSDLSEKIRHKIDLDIDLLHLDNPKAKNLDRSILRYFYEIKRRNEKFYNKILGMLVSDDYKMIYMGLQSYSITRDDMNRLEFYRTLDGENVAPYLEMNPDVLICALYQMSEFNGYDYFGKRNILIECQKERKKLYELSSFSILDYLYYCQIFDLKKLKSIFSEKRKDGCSHAQALDLVTDDVEQLLLVDTKNYVELVSDLLYRYYLLLKNHYFDNDKYDIVNYIKSEEEKDILNYIKDEKVIKDIIRKNICYTISSDKLKLDKCDEKTIQKIKSIKEIYK